MSQAPERPVILAVDDDPEILALVTRALREEYRVLTAGDAGTALELAAASPRPDLILLDIEMPEEASGFDLCRVLKAQGSSTAGIPVIFLTANTDARVQVEGLELGAVDYITKPIAAAVLRARVRTHLALADRRLELERLVNERTGELEQTRLQLIRRLARAMEHHESSAPGNRVTRLSQYARVLAEAAQATPALCEMLMTAAPLHDIGKLGVPAKLLRKRKKLSALERERVKRHPQLGAEIIGEHADPLLKMAREIALHHHERWDGKGYPEGLKGNDIPWAARVMAIVDTFESMTTAQFHRSPLNALQAVAKIADGAGSRFDPRLVEAFTKALPLMYKVRETYADDLGDLIDLDFSVARRARPAQPAFLVSHAKVASQAKAKR
jgi:putative two-component system response regulator